MYTFNQKGFYNFKKGNFDLLNVISFAVMLERIFLGCNNSLSKQNIKSNFDMFKIPLPLSLFSQYIFSFLRSLSHIQIFSIPHFFLSLIYFVLTSWIDHFVDTYSKLCKNFFLRKWSVTSKSCYLVNYQCMVLGTL